jgi:hypothetical protein
MLFTENLNVSARVGLCSIAMLLAPQLYAQRDNRVVAATQGFAIGDCRTDCVLDTLTIDAERGRRAQPGVINATLILVDTVSQPRRGGPTPPKDRAITVWIACDETPCGAAVLTGRIADRRVDDAHVVRRTAAVWALPAPLLQRMSRAAVSVIVEGRTHLLSDVMISSLRAVINAAQSSTANASPASSYSPRALLYVATFATFGIPSDSIVAEDVGTATEPLMMPDATTTMPTRVATLTLAGRGAAAIPLLVQDDATGAAPLFGIGERVTIALPAKVGRRGVATARIAARQRVETLRDACQSMKIWTYLLTIAPADLASLQRGTVSSPRTDEIIDRWSGSAVRETIAPRMAAAEQRAIAGSRAVVSQFVREREASGVRERDVQVLASLARGTSFVTNFGVFTRDQGGNWRFPMLNLRPATCP